MTSSASSSSVTRITPSCAVIADPERPATRIAASTGPSSRMMPIPSDVDDVDIRAEGPQLIRREIGEHDPDEKPDERSDAERLRARAVERG